MHACMAVFLDKYVHVTALSFISVVNKGFSMDGLRLNFLSIDLYLADLTSLSLYVNAMLYYFI